MTWSSGSRVVAHGPRPSGTWSSPVTLSWSLSGKPLRWEVPFRYRGQMALNIRLPEDLDRQLDVIEHDDPRRTHLQSLISQLREGLRELPWTLLPSQTAIQPLIVGESKSALELSAQLREAGIWVPAIRPPTVPMGTARLRISLSAAHTDAQVQQLVTALRRCAGRGQRSGRTRGRSPVPARWTASWQQRCRHSSVGGSPPVRRGAQHRGNDSRLESPRK